MDGEAQLVIGLVVHLVVAEGYVADTEVEEVPPVGGLETGHLDVRLRVQLLGDAPGDGVQLHTVEAAALHGLREQSEEIAHAHAGFYVPTDFDTKRKALSRANAAEKGLK